MNLKSNEVTFRSVKFNILEIDSEQLSRLIRSRRSLKPEKFIKGKTVPEEVINEMLENATWAPTHGQTEPWQFIVFEGDGIKKLAKFQSDLYREKAGDAFLENKYIKLQQTPLNASHVIAICMRRQPSGKIAEIEEVEAVACAVQNMMLTAAAYGVIAFWGSGGITYWEEAKPFFNLGPEDKLLGYLYLGYPSITPVTPFRTPYTEKTVWVREEG